MKKRSVFCLLLAAALLFCSCQPSLAPETKPEPGTETTPADAATTEELGEGVNSAVNAPMKNFPDYTLPADATTDEIRAMAIKAMKDGLSLKWTPYKTMTYEKSLNKNMKDFKNVPGTVYAGMPYTDGATGVLTFLQYYDFETGVMSGYDETQVNDLLGNSCANAVAWGWHAVVPHSFIGATYTFVVDRGALRVGPYTYDDSIKSLRDYSTKKICDDNGDDVMLRSYAECLPADCVVSVGSPNAGDHAMMVIEPAHVEYTDGKIDPKNSYLVIQDQRGGNYEFTEDGQTVHYSGRTRAEISFESLLHDHYIPHTHPVFTGAQPYTPSSVTLDSEEDLTLQTLNEKTVVSPYKIIALTVTLTDQDGKTAYTTRRVLNSSYFTKETCYNYPGTNLPGASQILRNTEKGKTYHYELKVQDATGRFYTPASFDFTA